MTEWLHFHFSPSCIGEGNGNPLQCSCLENLRDGRAWWAAVCGVAQSQTRLKQLSSSSSSLEWWKSAFKTHDMYNPTELHCLIWIGFKEPLWEERGNHPYTDSSQVIWVNQKTSNWNLIVKLYMLVVTPEMRLAKKKIFFQFSSVAQLKDNHPKLSIITINNIPYIIPIAQKQIDKWEDQS